MSNNEPENEEIRSDGAGTVTPDNKTPTWSKRKVRKTGLSRLICKYFKRARREDQDLHTEPGYVERDVLAFPTWPHETIHNLSTASSSIGMILFLSAMMPPHIGGPADSSSIPAVILPDWYLYWLLGLLELGPLSPEIAILGDQMLMADRVYGVLTSGVVIGFIAIVPFLNKGSVRRPVKQLFWSVIGAFGVVFVLIISLLVIKNLMSMSVDLPFDLTSPLSFVFGTVVYAALETMREGCVYDLNRRYCRFRPPRQSGTITNCPFLAPLMTDNDVTGRTSDSSGTGRGRRGRRDIVAPMWLYKMTTVFSTFVIVVSVILGFVSPDATTLQMSASRAVVADALGVPDIGIADGLLSTALVIVGLSIIAFGVVVRTLGTRFRAQGMGESRENSSEDSNND